MQCYAVVDTNVIVSAVIAKNPDSPPRQVFRAMLSGDIIPLYHPEGFHSHTSKPLTSKSE